MADDEETPKNRVRHMKRRAEEMRTGNQLKPGFVIRLVQRVYDGVPRWKEGHPTYKEHTPTRPQWLARDTKIVDKIQLAWGKLPTNDVPGKDDLEHFFDNTHSMLTCTNPDCSERSQLHYKKRSSHVRYTRMCDTCGELLALQMFQPIENKWLYILSGEAGAPAKEPGIIKLVEEVWVENEDAWHILPNPGIKARKSRKITSKNRHVRNTTVLHLVREKELYHFFLSPVQLSKRALQELLKFAGQQLPIFPVKQPANYRDGSVEQLDAVTVRRRFSNPPRSTENLGQRPWETVAVAEPFAWSQEVAVWDYQPMLEAQYEFLMNLNERAKANIASVLNALVGEKDKHDLIDEMEKGAKKLKTKHKAEAFFEKYEACNKFLVEQVRDACLRLIEWLDSDAHRIVEMACQGPKPKTDYLAGGINHYLAVLRDIMGCQAGEAFIARLHRPVKKRTPKGDEEQRIPNRNLLDPDKRGRLALRRIRKKKHSGDTALHLLTIFMPAVIRSTPVNQVPKKMLTHLRALGVKARTEGKIKSPSKFPYPALRLVAKSLVAINITRVEKTGQAFLPQRLHNKVHKHVVVINDIDSFLLGALDLWMGAKVYSEMPQAGESYLDKFRRSKDRVEYPFKAIGFAIKLGQLGLVQYAKRAYKLDLDKFTSRVAGTQVYPAGVYRLMTSKDISRFRSNINWYKSLKFTGRILAGPIGLVFGGIDLVLQASDTYKAWRTGDHALMLAGGALVGVAAISVWIGVVGTLAMLGVAWGQAMLATLGVLGIAALLLAAFAAILYIWKKSDLEKFAAHCFLGDYEGQGGSSPKWAEGRRFSKWASGPQRYIQQARYLTNLIGSFSVQIRKPPSQWAKGPPASRWGCSVRPGYLPPGAKCEIEITSYYHKKGWHTEAIVLNVLMSTMIVNMDTGDFICHGDALIDHSAEATPSHSWGGGKFIGFDVTMEHKLPPEFEIPQVRSSLSGRDIDVPRWTVKVRMDVSGAGHFLPLGKDKYVEIDSWKGPMTRSSSDVWPVPLGSINGFADAEYTFRWMLLFYPSYHGEAGRCLGRKSKVPLDVT